MGKKVSRGGEARHSGAGGEARHSGAGAAPGCVRHCHHTPRQPGHDERRPAARLPRGDPHEAGDFDEDEISLTQVKEALVTKCNRMIIGDYNSARDTLDSAAGAEIYQSENMSELIQNNFRC